MPLGHPSTEGSSGTGFASFPDRSFVSRDWSSPEAQRGDGTMNRLPTLHGVLPFFRDRDGEFSRFVFDSAWLLCESNDRVARSLDCVFDLRGPLFESTGFVIEFTGFVFDFCGFAFEFVGRRPRCMGRDSGSRGCAFRSPRRAFESRGRRIARSECRSKSRGSAFRNGRCVFRKTGRGARSSDPRRSRSTR